MKYKVRKDLKLKLGKRTLYRIEKCDTKILGGWIETEKNLSQQGSCWVHANAQVYDNAQISGNAQVYDNAQVSGKAWVDDNARVDSHTQVFGNAQISGNAQVSGRAWVYDNARVSGKARVSGNARAYGNAQVFDDAQVSGNAQVYGDAQVYGKPSIWWWINLACSVVNVGLMIAGYGGHYPAGILVLNMIIMGVMVYRESRALR